MKRILVIAPHCDDAELGVGGYMAKEVKAGAKVMVVVATVSDVAMLHAGRVVTASERKSELASALSVLGVHDWKILTEGYDSNLNTYPSGKMVAELDVIQNEFQPSEILIPMPSSHQDHRYMWEVCVAATRPSISKYQPKLVAAYEYPYSSWGEGAKMSSFTGGMYVNITNEIELKAQALESHSSQMRENTLLSVNGAKALATMRGLEAGFPFAELLYILRMRIK